MKQRGIDEGYWRRIPLAVVVASAAFILLGTFGSGDQAEAQTGSCNGQAVTIWGTPGDDDIQGTAGADVIHLLSGDDTVDGRGGNDIICGGDGRDRIYGGNGQDHLFGGPGIDYIWGGRDADQLYGEGGSDRLRGGPGGDLIEGGSGADRIWGQDDADTLKGQGGQDTMWGGSGNDTMIGNWQSDEMRGGPGGDTINGNGGKDRLFGDDGRDTLSGGDNADTLDGGAGDDSLLGGRGADTLRGGFGTDVLNGQNHADTCVDVRATTTFISCASASAPLGVTFQVTHVPDPNAFPAWTDFEVFIADVSYSFVTTSVVDFGDGTSTARSGAVCDEMLIEYPGMTCEEIQYKQTDIGDDVPIGFLDANGQITVPASDGPVRLHAVAAWPAGGASCFYAFQVFPEPGDTRLETAFLVQTGYCAPS